MKILNELAKNSPENVEKIQKEYIFEEKTENIEKPEEKGNQIIEEGEDKKQAEIEEKIDETAIDSSGEYNIRFQFSSNKVGKYKEEFKNQHVLYENVILDYKKWISRIQELVAYIKKGYENIGKESGRNELNIKLEKMIQIDEVSCNKLFNVDNFRNSMEEQIKSYINANRNIIEDGIKERDSLIDKYFVLVNSYMFPLIDNFNFKSSIGTDVEEKNRENYKKLKNIKSSFKVMI